VGVTRGKVAAWFHASSKEGNDLVMKWATKVFYLQAIAAV
jgi:hypothetical protein